MEIRLEDQASTDFDWFCVDEAGEIGHFTTAGFKQLPPSVSSSAEDLAVLTKYFEKDAPIKCGHLMDGDLEAELPNWKRLDLRSFIAMADRGLYSYDIESYLKPGICYFRVASPLVPLRLVDIPESIREIVERTALQASQLRSCSRVPYKKTLEI